MPAKVDDDDVTFTEDSLKRCGKFLEITAQPEDCCDCRSNEICGKANHPSPNSTDLKTQPRHFSSKCYDDDTL